MADLFGSMISESSYGALHTHSAVTKVDLDIAGTANSFKKKYPALGNVQELLASTGIDTTGIVTQSPTTYYFATEKITNEGVWDNDGDMTWTPPEACMRSETGYKYIQYSNAETDIGNKRGYKISVPGSFPQLLPEHDKFLHLQNFTKCDIAVTKQSEDDKEAVSQLVFGNLYPLPAPAGQDISHFFNGESLEDVDIVLYLSGTKHHYVQTEDVPVPTTMGKGIVFEPYNYFTDDVSTFKHLPKSMYRYGQKSGRGLRDATKPIPQCTIPDGMIEPSLPMESRRRASVDESRNRKD
jgi:primary-amine oxidase